MVNINPEILWKKKSETSGLCMTASVERWCNDRCGKTEVLIGTAVPVPIFHNLSHMDWFGSQTQVCGWCLISWTIRNPGLCHFSRHKTNCQNTDNRDDGKTLMVLLQVLQRSSTILCFINLLATDFFQILAHPVFKMWVIQKQNKVASWNKWHFEEKKMEIIQHV